MGKIIYIGFLVSFLILSLDCKKDTSIISTKEDTSQIILTLRDTTLTEAWIKLSFVNTKSPHAYRLFRDSILVSSGTLISNDTIFYEYSLEPHHRYRYLVFADSNKIDKDPNAQLIVKTMDTTSHSFQLQKFILGYQESQVNDIAIYNDTLAYAVGMFYHADSNVIDQPLYNVARWNGKEWTLLKVNVLFDGDKPIYAPGEIGAITIISPTNIVLSFYNEIFQWDGQSEIGSDYTFLSDNILNIWSFKEDVYCCGRNGTLYSKINKTWSNYSSISKTDFKDIYGVPDGDEVWVTGWSNTVVTTGAIIRLNEGVASKLYDYEANPVTDLFISRQQSLWIDKSKIYFSGTNGYISVYHRYRNITNVRFDKRFSDFILSIRGAAPNNIMTVGQQGMVAHWNGLTWREFLDFKDPNRNITSIEVTNKLFIAGGRLRNGVYRTAEVIIGLKTN